MTLLALMLLTVTSAVTASPSPSFIGDWVAPSKSIVRVYNCGDKLCLKIVKLSPTAPETRDAKNPDATLRDRPLCGLNIGSGFRPVNPTQLVEGKLYDPQSGHTYSGTIDANGDEMKLRGYIGISLLGRTEIWHRVSETPDTACHP